MHTVLNDAYCSLYTSVFETHARSFSFTSSADSSYVLYTVENSEGVNE